MIMIIYTQKNNNRFSNNRFINRVVADITGSGAVVNNGRGQRAKFTKHVHMGHDVVSGARLLLLWVSGRRLKGES